MILALHILIALATVGISIYAAIRPTTSRIHLTSYGALFTLASGVILVVFTSANLVHACISGCIVLSMSLGLQFVARRRLLQASV